MCICVKERERENNVKREAGNSQVAHIEFSSPIFVELGKLVSTFESYMRL